MLQHRNVNEVRYLVRSWEKIQSDTSMDNLLQMSCEFVEILLSQMSYKNRGLLMLSQFQSISSDCKMKNADKVKINQHRSILGRHGAS